MRGLSAPGIVEIGAGLGRTAYYAWQLDIRDYTIIDIPMSGVAQAYFLGRTLGEKAIRLFGEEEGPGIRILPPAAFLAAADRYDLVVNVNSLTEMARETAVSYVDQIERRADLFWSVNHEANAFCVRELFSPSAAAHVTRTPYWLRPGYVDEVLDLRAPNSRHGLRRRLGRLTIGRMQEKIRQLLVDKNLH